MKLTQITTCKGRAEHVLKHINGWLETEIDELVVVDYACPDNVTRQLFPVMARDPRVHVVKVFPSLVGGAFHLTRARNIGAQAASGDLFMFMDADVMAKPQVVDKIRQRFTDAPVGLDLLIPHAPAAREDFVHNDAKDLPSQWVLDGQCVISNPLFYRVNGYNQRLTSWGGESYDLYIRARYAGARVGDFGYHQFKTLPHADCIRDQHLSQKFSLSGEGPEARFRQYRVSLSLARRCRRHEFRGAPGQAIGAPADSIGDRIIHIHRNKPARWSPGDLD